jgi:hypothetical protein
MEGSMKFIFKDNISAHTFRLSLVRQGKKCTVYSVKIDGKIVWVVSDEEADSTKGARIL